jgi:hypothetical protein
MNIGFSVRNTCADKWLAFLQRELRQTKREAVRGKEEYDRRLREVQVSSVTETQTHIQ